MSEPFFVLAPMDDVTDVSFRSVIAECYAPDVFFTEFVNVDGLQSRGRSKLIHKLLINKNTDHNIIGQIWGKKPENYKEVASQLVDMGFHGVDINMGCPQKNEVKNGCCSALINDRELASLIIKATQEGAAGRIPVSVKCRLGWNEIDLSWHEFLLGHNLAMLTIHMRTRKEMSDVPAHWDIMPQIVALRDKISPSTKLVINGDIMDRVQGIEIAAQTGCDGVMIGRGIFRNAYCFSPESEWETMETSQRLQLYLKHIERFKESYPNREKGFYGLRKFCKLYTHGLDNATEIRNAIMQSEDIEAMLDVCKDYIG